MQPIYLGLSVDLPGHPGRWYSGCLAFVPRTCWDMQRSALPRSVVPHLLQLAAFPALHFYLNSRGKQCDRDRRPGKMNWRIKNLATSPIIPSFLRLQLTWRANCTFYRRRVSHSPPPRVLFLFGNIVVSEFFPTRVLVRPGPFDPLSSSSI